MREAELNCRPEQSQVPYCDRAGPGCGCGDQTRRIGRIADNYTQTLPILLGQGLLVLSGAAIVTPLFDLKCSINRYISHISCSRVYRAHFLSAMGSFTRSRYSQLPKSEPCRFRYFQIYHKIQMMIKI